MAVKTFTYERALEPVLINRTVDHQFVHEGRVFFLEIDYGSIGAATNNVVIKTGNNVVHLRRLQSFNENGNLFVKLYENPTLSTIGNAQTTICANRFIEERRTATAQFYRDGVATNLGTLLKTVYDFGKTGTGSLASEAVPEIILDKNANYFIQAQHYTPSGNVAISLAWYEFEH